MAYHDSQPFNENMLRPCPMLENPQKLRKMVEESGAEVYRFAISEVCGASLCEV